MIIAITNDGYIKKTSKKEFEVQGIQTKGIYKSYYVGDIKVIKEASMYDTLFLYTEKGQCFQLEVMDIPITNNNEKGLCLNEKFKTSDSFCSILSVKQLLNSNDINDYFVLIMTKNGKIVKQRLSDYKEMTNGIFTMSFDGDDSIADVSLTTKDKKFIFNCMTCGLGKTFDDTFKPNLLKSQTKGTSCSSLVESNVLVCFDVTNNERNGYLLVSKKGYLIRTKDCFLAGRRGGGCMINLNQNDSVVFNMFADIKDDILIVTKKGYTTRLNVGSLKEIYRGGRGSLCIKLSENDNIVACCKITSNSSLNKIVFDNKKLDLLKEDTAKSYNLLSSIYNNQNDLNDPIEINSIDIRKEILKELMKKNQWLYFEVEELCRKNNVMMGSILEQINEYSYEVVEDSVIEDDGEYINVIIEYKDKLI